jgi:preprotein translocase subunit SecY
MGTYVQLDRAHETAFGGTSLLIVVGVALDTVGQMESHLLRHHYEGFPRKRQRVRG